MLIRPVLLAWFLFGFSFCLRPGLADVGLTKDQFDLLEDSFTTKGWDRTTSLAYDHLSLWPLTAGEWRVLSESLEEKADNLPTRTRGWMIGIAKLRGGDKDGALRALEAFPALDDQAAKRHLLVHWLADHEAGMRQIIEAYPGLDIAWGVNWLLIRHGVERANRFLAAIGKLGHPVLRQQIDLAILSGDRDFPDRVEKAGIGEKFRIVWHFEGRVAARRLLENAPEDITPKDFATVFELDPDAWALPAIQDKLDKAIARQPDAFEPLVDSLLGRATHEQLPPYQLLAKWIRSDPESALATLRRKEAFATSPSVLVKAFYEAGFDDPFLHLNEHFPEQYRHGAAAGPSPGTWHRALQKAGKRINTDLADAVVRSSVGIFGSFRPGAGKELFDRLFLPLEPSPQLLAACYLRLGYGGAAAERATALMEKRVAPEAFVVRAFLDQHLNAMTNRGLSETQKAELRPWLRWFDQHYQNLNEQNKNQFRALAENVFDQQAPRFAEAASERARAGAPMRPKDRQKGVNKRPTLSLLWHLPYFTFLELTPSGKLYRPMAGQIASSTWSLADRAPWKTLSNPGNPSYGCTTLLESLAAREDAPAMIQILMKSRKQNVDSPTALINHYTGAAKKDLPGLRALWLATAVHQPEAVKKEGFFREAEQIIETALPLQLKLLAHELPQATFRFRSPVFATQRAGLEKLIRRVKARLADLQGPDEDAERTTRKHPFPTQEDALLYLNRAIRAIEQSPLCAGKYPERQSMLAFRSLSGHDQQAAQAWIEDQLARVSRSEPRVQADLLLFLRDATSDGRFFEHKAFDGDPAALEQSPQYRETAFELACFRHDQEALRAMLERHAAHDPVWTARTLASSSLLHVFRGAKLLDLIKAWEQVARLGLVRYETIDRLGPWLAGIHKEVAREFLPTVIKNSSVPYTGNRTQLFLKKHQAWFRRSGGLLGADLVAVAVMPSLNAAFGFPPSTANDKDKETDAASFHQKAHRFHHGLDLLATLDELGHEDISSHPDFVYAAFSDELRLIIDLFNAPDEERFRTALGALKARYEELGIVESISNLKILINHNPRAKAWRNASVSVELPPAASSAPSPWYRVLAEVGRNRGRQTFLKTFDAFLESRAWEVGHDSLSSSTRLVEPISYLLRWGDEEQISKILTAFLKGREDQKPWPPGLPQLELIDQLFLQNLPTSHFDSYFDLWAEQIVQGTGEPRKPVEVYTALSVLAHRAGHPELAAAARAKFDAAIAARFERDRANLDASYASKMDLLTTGVKRPELEVFAVSRSPDHRLQLLWSHRCPDAKPDYDRSKDKIIRILAAAGEVDKATTVEILVSEDGESFSSLGERDLDGPSGNFELKCPPDSRYIRCLYRDTSSGRIRFSEPALIPLPAPAPTPAAGDLDEVKSEGGLACFVLKKPKKGQVLQKLATNPRRGLSYAFLLQIDPATGATPGLMVRALDQQGKALQNFRISQIEEPLCKGLPGWVLYRDTIDKLPAGTTHCDLVLAAKWGNSGWHQGVDWPVPPPRLSLLHFCPLEPVAGESLPHVKRLGSFTPSNGMILTNSATPTLVSVKASSVSETSGLITQSLSPGAPQNFFPLPYQIIPVRPIALRNDHLFFLSRTNEMHEMWGYDCRKGQAKLLRCLMNFGKQAPLAISLSPDGERVAVIHAIKQGRKEPLYRLVVFTLEAEGFMKSEGHREVPTKTSPRQPEIHWSADSSFVAFCKPGANHGMIKAAGKWQPADPVAHADYFDAIAESRAQDHIPELDRANGPLRFGPADEPRKVDVTIPNGRIKHLWPLKEGVSYFALDTQGIGYELSEPGQ